MNWFTPASVKPNRKQRFILRKKTEKKKCCISPSVCLYRLCYKHLTIQITTQREHSAAYQFTNKYLLTICVYARNDTFKSSCKGSSYDFTELTPSEVYPCGFLQVFQQHIPSPGGKKRAYLKILKLFFFFHKKLFLNQNRTSCVVLAYQRENTESFWIFWPFMLLEALGALLTVWWNL